MHSLEFSQLRGGHAEDLHSTFQGVGALTGQLFSRKSKHAEEEVQYALFYNTDGQQLMHSAIGTGETSGASGQPTATDPSSRQSCFPLPCCQTDRGIPGVGWLSHTHLVKQKTFVDFTLVRADDF